MLGGESDLVGGHMPTTTMAETLDVFSNHVLRRKQAEELLKSNGISPSTSAVSSLLDELSDEEGNIDMHALLQSEDDNVLQRTLTGELAVPDWKRFTTEVKAVFDDVKKNVHGGKNADYIPILATQDPDLFAVSITTVDGQQLNLGDCDVDFSLQSCVKPLLYGVVAQDNGLKRTHQFVGYESSGLAFNEVSLNEENRPHNPMINPGAMAVGSIFAQDLEPAARFQLFMKRLQQFAGSEHVGFSQPTYLCEQETAWRNNAILFYLSHAGVFPTTSHPDEILDFYLQTCSIEMSTRAVANVAATLATGGTNPLTNTQCLAPQITKAVLTLMFSCGLYDFSGEWCVTVGLPAKSGVSGVMYVVVPHVMGIAIMSPRLDPYGNSVRAVEFCRRLFSRYRCGVFDSLVEETGNPRFVGESAAFSALGKTTSRIRQTLSASSGTPSTHTEALKRYSKKKKRGNRTPKDKTAQMAHKAHAYGYLFTVLKRMTRLCRSFQMYGHAELATDDDNDLANKLYDELELPESQPWKIRASPGFEFVRLGVPDLLAVLRWKGFEVHAKRFPVLYTQILRILHNAFQNGRRGYLLPCDVVLSGETSNLVTSALMGGLSMPMFDNFQRDVWEVFQVAKRLHNDGSIEPQIKRAVRPEEDAFGVAICTTDGQTVSFGLADTQVPLMETVKPLLYALGLKDVGRRALHQFVGNEPTAMDPSGFSLLTVTSRDTGPDASQGQARVGEIKAKVEEVKEESDDAYESEEKNGIVNHPSTSRRPNLIPFNPFVDSGALAICSVLGRAHLPRDQRTFGDRGGRFSHVLSHISEWAGARKIGFHNPLFLCLKSSSLKIQALSHYIKGMDCYPKGTMPTDNAHLYFQTCAIQTTPKDLAVIAATFANRGVCPTTGVRCLDKSALKETLSLMYNCGMNQFTGKWNFSVGIPASSGSSGMTFVVVPGVMGMAIYSPKVNKYNVSSQAHQFVELMTKRYRLSVFDRLVYRDLPLEALPEPRTTHTTQQTVLFFELCMNASKGNVEKVEKLLREGVDVNRADYDNRTALHIACSDGHAAVVSLLISEGADILAKDRWGQTPFDDAVRQGHGYITDLLLSALELQGYRIAPLRRAILTETRNDEPHGSLQSPSLRSASQMADSPQDGEFQGNGSTQDVASEPAPRREREVSFGTTSPRPLSSTARQHRRVGFHGPIVETQEEDKSSEGSAGETRSDPW